MSDLVPLPEPGSFSSSYASARQSFLAACEDLEPSQRRHQQVFAHPLAGPDGETLACDLLQLGQASQAECLLVLISATHGIEGFAGSAIQRDCLPILEAILAKESRLGVLMIHALNPWGFAWLRRYDHQGIDLNRNFVNFATALPDNPDYDRLHSALLASRLDSSERLRDLWREVGQEAFVEVVTRGQYRHGDGLFFGGRGPAWSQQILRQITALPVFAAARQIAVIDLHTGLGPYGYGEVINDHAPSSAGFDLASTWYGDNACSTVLGQSVSSRKQGLLDFYWHEQIGERGCFVTLEFGTYDPERLLTSLINEQVWHNQLARSGRPRELGQAPIQALKDFFCPTERSWQQQVLFRGRQVVDLAIRGMLS